MLIVELDSHPKGDIAWLTTTFVASQGRLMYGRKYITAILAGLTQDLQLITIRAIGARSFFKIISINHFLKGHENEIPIKF